MIPSINLNNRPFTDFTSLPATVMLAGKDGDGCNSSQAATGHTTPAGGAKTPNQPPSRAGEHFEANFEPEEITWKEVSSTRYSVKTKSAKILE